MWGLNKRALLLDDALVAPLWENKGPKQGERERGHVTHIFLPPPQYTAYTVVVCAFLGGRENKTQQQEEENYPPGI